MAGAEMLDGDIRIVRFIEAFGLESDGVSFGGRARDLGYDPRQGGTVGPSAQKVADLGGGLAQSAAYGCT